MDEQSDKREASSQLEWKYLLTSKCGYWTPINIIQNEVRTPHIVVFCDYYGHRNEMYNSIGKVSTVSKLFQDLRFFISDISEIQKGCVKFNKNKPPTIYAVYHDTKCLFQDTYDVNGLIRFCNNFRNQSKFKSEPIPDNQQDQFSTTNITTSHKWGIKKVVAITFHELVIDNRKDVVLFLYGRSCAVSQAAFVQLRKLAKMLYDNGESNNIDIFRMNMQANTLQINIDSHYSPPLLALVRRNEKTVVVKVWGQNLSVHSMIKFVAQNSTKLLKNYDRNGDRKNDNQKHKHQDDQYDSPHKYYNRFHSFTTSII